jgi:hypothetical protein
MDYTDSERYKKRLESEEEQAKINRAKRDDKKKSAKLNIQLGNEKLKEHSTGLITWKKNNNKSLTLEGFVDNKKCFKISYGIYKYSLSIYIETAIKKDKNLKTDFELGKLQLVAESIMKKNPQKEEKDLI